MMAESDPAKPIRITESIGYVPAGMVQREYSVSHARPWGWQVSAYLWTKSIAAGTFLVAAVLLLLGAVGSSDQLLTVTAPALALAFLAVTIALLVMDLERPERFWRVIFRPQWRSWLVIGAYILAAYGVVAAAATLVGIAGQTGLQRGLLWPGSILAVTAAGYTAFLLAQARGRDLWQSQILPAHIVTQAVLAGAAALALPAALVDRTSLRPISIVLALGLGVSLCLIVSELSLPHATAHARLAIEHMTRGHSAVPFWIGVMTVGTALPLAFAGWAAAGGPAPVGAVAAVCALAGLAWYEDMYIRAGQSVPLS
jgi:formate-dependent nitrite reductase membrane component NrfD